MSFDLCKCCCWCCYTPPPPQNQQIEVPAQIELPPPPSRGTSPSSPQRRLGPPLKQNLVQNLSFEVAQRAIPQQNRPLPSRYQLEHQRSLSSISEGSKQDFSESAVQSPQIGPDSPPVMSFQIPPNLPRVHSFSSKSSAPTPESVIRFDAAAKKNFAKLKEAVMCFDKTTFEITFANKKAIVLFGCDPIGKNIKLFFPRFDLSQKLESDKTYNTEAYKGNTLFSVEFSLTSGTEQSQKIANIWIQTIHPKESNIQRHLDDHDARNALIAVGGHIRLLSESGTVPKTLLSGLSSASDEALNIFEASLEKTKGVKTLEIIDFQAFHARATERLKVSAPDHAFSFIISPDLPQFVQCPSQNDLIRILGNLVGNAAKFTDKGKKITAQISKSSTEEGILVFEVIDEGPGMTDEQAATLFKPFVQLDPKKKGTGLGLTSCRLLVDEMNPDKTNNIGVRSALGKGSTFWFKVPFRLLPEEKKEAKKEEQLAPSKIVLSETDKQDLKGLHILVVDDGEINRKMFERQLKRLGCTSIECVEDGDLFISSYEGTYQTNPFDVIFTDLKMPKKTGQEATQAIRKNEKERHRALVIGCTGTISEGTKDSCLEAGMNDVLAKPIKDGDLLRLLLPVARKKVAKLD